MASASISGLVSGLDTATIINQLMQLEALPQRTLQSRVSTQERQVNALQTLNSKLASIAGKAVDLAKAASWSPVTAKSSNELVSATAAAGADPASLTFEITRTASGSRAAYATTATADQAGTVAAGLTVTVRHDNGDTATFSTGDGSLADIAAAINDPANETGLTAALVKSGTAADGTPEYQLRVASTATGVQSGFQLDDGTGGFLGGVAQLDGSRVSYAASAATASSTYALNFADGTSLGFDTGTGSLADVAAAINAAATAAGTDVEATVETMDGGQRLFVTATDGRRFTVEPTGATADPFAGGILSTSAGADAEITIGGQSLTSSSNTIADLMPGVDVTLKAGATGSATITVSRDGQSLADKVKAMVDAVNSALTDIDSLTAYDAGSGAAGLLTGDSMLRSIRNELLASITGGIDGSSFASVGIEVSREGKITFDSAKFTEAYEADPTGTAAKFAGRLTADLDDPSAGTVELHGATWRSQPGTYRISADSTGGSIDGRPGKLVGSLLTGADGSPVDGLTVDVSGQVSGTITFTHGLAAKLEALSQRASNSVNGTMTLSIQGREGRIDRLEDDITDWDVRLDLRRQSLERQYAALEVALGRMQNQSSWLAGQIAGLPSYSSGS